MYASWAFAAEGRIAVSFGRVKLLICHMSLQVTAW
jgi:hypothetical protein